MLRKTRCTSGSYQPQQNLPTEKGKRTVVKHNLLKGKIQAARPLNTNRMQSDTNVVLVKNEISLRETTIDGCVQRRRKRRMELHLEKALRFFQNNQPQKASASRRQREECRWRRGRRWAPGFSALSNPGEFGCGAAQSTKAETCCQLESLVKNHQPRLQNVCP